MARRPQIVTRGRVDEPGDHFAQAQPPEASSIGRIGARRAVAVRTARPRREALRSEFVRGLFDKLVEKLVKKRGTEFLVSKLESEMKGGKAKGGKSIPEAPPTHLIAGIAERLVI
jgi:hypothetical protein